MSQNDASKTHMLKALLHDIGSALNNWLRDVSPEAEHAYRATETVAVEEAAKYLIDLGFGPTAKRLMDHHRKLVMLRTDIACCDAARGKSRQRQEWLTEVLGPYPAPDEPDEEHKESQRILCVKLIGETGLMADFVEALESRLADSGTEETLDDIVTLNQAAALAGQSKRNLERYMQNDSLPVPDFPGGEGKAHKWLWGNLRPALEKLVNRKLPKKFPSSRII